MPETPTTIAVVMAAFNRRETTLRCLRSLLPQATELLRIEVFLLDDASPDGTARAVREEFPEIQVVHGDGQRFWGGGMYLAMQRASAAPFDFMLWLNDDVELNANAISSLLDAHSQARAADRARAHVIIGAVEDPETGEISYAGFNRRNRWHPAQLARVSPRPGVLTPCDTMNGNCVLVPAEVVRSVGLIDPTYVQQLGDIDYGYRVARAGGKLWIAPAPVGACAPNRKKAGWQDPLLGLPQRLRILNTPHGLPLCSWMPFMWRHGGPLGGVLLALIYAKAIAGPLTRRPPQALA